MILGIGSDLIDIKRIEAALNRHGDRFLQRCFTASEIAKARSRARRGQMAATLAKSFAAKEACAKALGTGFRDNIALRDISVENNDAGRPDLILRGAALTRLGALVPPGHVARLHLTLTDEPPMAFAQVIIEALPDAGTGV